MSAARHEKALQSSERPTGLGPGRRTPLTRQAQTRSLGQVFHYRCNGHISIAYIFQSIHTQEWVDAIVNNSALPDPITRDSTHSSKAGSILEWYRSYGYQPLEEDLMAGASTDTTDRQTEEGTETQTAKSKSRKPSGAAAKPQFYSGLRDRNINFRASADEKMESILNLIVKNPPAELSEEEEANWRLDLIKCDNSQEAIFQRTIMIDVIDRHKLGTMLDYTCESIWTCKAMPRLNATENYTMAPPKPDLAVAFRSEVVVSDFSLPRMKPFLNYMCPEAYRESNADRAFHFFSLEAKGAQFSDRDFIGFRQNHNTASQALYNMWTFMKVAGMEREFFKEVRFFSATATSAGFQVRMHRAVELDNENEHIAKGYPLAFQFDELFRTRGTHKKAEISSLIRNIFFEYGVKKLLPILQEAAQIVLQRLRNQQQRQAAHGKRPAADSFSSQQQLMERLAMDDSTGSFSSTGPGITA